MTKKIISAILALTMLFMTACGADNSTDTSKADTTTTAVEQGNSEIDSSSDSEETTTTTADTTTTTSDTSKKEEKSSDTTTTSATTTTAKAQATTTTKQAAVTTKATVKPVQTTKATTKSTTKATVKTTKATQATQPARNKSALDLAYEAVILGTSTKAQRDLICNDLNNYVIAKGYSKKLDKSLYALSDANGKPVEDVTKAVGWGNCGFEGGSDNSTYTTAYLLGKSTLEKAREDYKANLRGQIDFNVATLKKVYSYRNFANQRFNVVTYKDDGLAPQRLDLKNKYKIPRYTTVLCYSA